MMDALAYYKAGQLASAIEVLGTELRKQPTDTRRRTFLFELLCFAGEYDRAVKHLDILASGGKDAEAGAMLYRSALHAQRTREEMFLRGDIPEAGDAAPVPAVIDGEQTSSLVDEDDRIGSNLEVFIAGSYTWIPYRYIQSIELRAPSNLRDLLWAPAVLQTTKSFRLQDLGEVLLPALAPLSWQHPDEAVRLGRVSAWREDAVHGAVPAGQKVLLSDAAEHPLLSIRSIGFPQTDVDAGDSATEQDIS